MEDLKAQGYDTTLLSDGTLVRLSKKKHPDDGVFHLAEANLRRRKLISLQRYDGVIHFHIRHFIVEQGGKYIYPSKVGVSLTMQQCRDLLEAMDALQEVIEDVSKTIF